MKDLSEAEGDSEYQGQPRAFGLPKKREEVLEALSEAYVQQQLDTEDYEQRVELAYRAKSLDALEKVIHDFPNKASIISPNATTSSASQPQWPVRINSERSFTLIGDKKLTLEDFGQTPAEVAVVIGDVKVDLRDLQDDSVIYINHFGLIGDLKIMVPEGVVVEKTLISLVGSFTRRKRRDIAGFFKSFTGKKEEPMEEKPKPLNNAVIKLAGFKVLGDVTIVYF